MSGKWFLRSAPTHLAAGVDRFCVLLLNWVGSACAPRHRRDEETRHHSLAAGWQDSLKGSWAAAAR